jgi:hypothetical protein
MPERLRGRFTKCEQDIHDLNTGDDMMVSRVYFVIIDDDGQEHPGSVTVRQQAGGAIKTISKLGPSSTAAARRQSNTRNSATS